MSNRAKIMTLVIGSGAVVVLAVAVKVSWSYLHFWWLMESLGLNQQGYPEYRHRQTGIVFVRIPGATFTMGAQDKDPNRPNYDPAAQDDEAPVHNVTLSPFLIAKYEITQAEWERVMASNASSFLGARFPVTSVSWDKCREFCRKTGLTLPTEAQWEYACRAHTKGPYGPTGRLDDTGWYGDNSGGESHPVGRKMPNDFGLHDMHGNVWEWCEDVYNPDFYAKPESRRKNPLSTSGPEQREVIMAQVLEYRIDRGGDWWNEAENCRCTMRGWSDPREGYDSVGFRPAFPLK